MIGFKKNRDCKKKKKKKKNRKVEILYSRSGDYATGQVLTL